MIALQANVVALRTPDYRRLCIQYEVGLFIFTARLQAFQISGATGQACSTQHDGANTTDDGATMASHAAQWCVMAEQRPIHYCVQTSAVL
jgi:hypothetical protein